MNTKKYGLIGGGILVLALVAAVGIVYAAYSQSLTINGTANVKANSWNIHFANLRMATNVGVQEITAPTIKNNSTTIGDYSVLFSKPNSHVKYSFDIVNEGTFDAIIYASDLQASTPICTGTGENAEEDAKNVCKYIVLGYELPKEYDISTESLLIRAGETVHDFGMSLAYSHYPDIPVEDLPKNDVIVSNLTSSITVAQAD